MKKYWMIIFTIACLACSSVNMQRSKLATETQEKVQQKEQQLSTKKTAKILADTGSAELEVAFWPKGMVKYSPITGFEGEAVKISVRSKQQKSSLINENTVENLSANKVLSLQKAESSEVKNAIRNKSHYYFWILGFLLIQGASIVYLLYKGKLVWVKN